MALVADAAADAADGVVFDDGCAVPTVLQTSGSIQPYAGYTTRY